MAAALAPQLLPDRPHLLAIALVACDAAHLLTKRRANSWLGVGLAPTFRMRLSARAAVRSGSENAMELVLTSSIA